jgi:signal transduction histidine kinase
VARGPRTPRPRAGANADDLLRQIVDRLADGVVIVGADGVVRFANPAAQRLFGRGADELVGAPFGFPATAGETTEIDVVRPGGVVVAAELRAVHTEWEGELAFLVSLRDVTDRREAETRRLEVEREQARRRAAEAEARRAHFLSRVSAALSGSLDYHRTLEMLARLAVPELADWCVIDVVEEDGMLRRVAGAHADEAKEPLLAELGERFPPSPEGPFPGTTALRDGRTVVERDATGAVLAAHARSAEHAALLRALGVRSFVAVPLLAAGQTLGAITFVCAERGYGEHDVALAEDFAQRAAASIGNARLYAAAQAGNRAKSEFLAVMSHELRTPLNAVMGYSDLLSAGVDGPVNDRQRRHLERIKGSARHLAQIIDEILAFSSLGSGDEALHLERVDLRELVRDASAVAEAAARERELEFHLRLPDEPAWVVTDAERVRQVLRNLLSNAVKFTDDGAVVVEALRDHTHHLVRVRDTGIGIAPEHRERVFEPFWQVEQSNRREVGGTGLGLAVALGLAKRLGATLSLESEPGRGSTFTLGLPAADTPEGAAAAANVSEDGGAASPAETPVETSVKTSHDGAADASAPQPRTAPAGSTAGG